MARTPLIRIQVQDGEQVHSITVPAASLRSCWADAHAIRQDWRENTSRREAAIAYLRDVARDDWVLRELPECSARIALAVLCDTHDAAEIAYVSAALAMPGAVLHVRLSGEGRPSYDVLPENHSPPKPQ